MSALSILLRAPAIVVVFAILLHARSSHASPNEDLQVAIETFSTGDFTTAIGQFGALLYPSSRLAKASSIAEAHLLLGVSYFEVGNHDNAGREFEEALFLDDSLSLKESLFSPEAIRFFDKRKAELVERATDAAEKETMARKEQALSRALQNLVVLEKRRYYVNYIPFGAGQFQNGQRGKGLAFFLGETLSGGASIGLWSYQIIKYSYRGRVPRDEVDTVRKLQVLQVGSGILFFAFYALGVVDSLSNYEHVIKREADPALLKDLEEVFKNDNKSGVRLVPDIGSESLGAALYWEF